MMVRPLYAFFVRKHVLPNQKVAFTWRLPPKQWWSLSRTSLIARLGILAATFLLLICLWARSAHISFVQSVFLIIAGEAALLIDALIPPRYYVTESGIVTKTPGAICIIRRRFRSDCCFVSWRRVKAMKVVGNRLYLRIVGGKGRLHPVYDKYVFDIRDLVFHLPDPDELRDEIQKYIEQRTAMARAVLNR